MRGAASRSGFCRADHRLCLVVGARGRRKHEAAIGDGGLQGVEKRGAVEDAISAGRHHARLVIGPALPRLDDAQPRQAEIRHGAGGGADIFAELRLDQDDDRPGRRDPGSCVLSVPAPGMQCSSAGNALKSQPLPKPAGWRQAPAPYPAEASPAVISHPLTRL